MEILITIGYIAVCVLMFSLAIAIHEFGHFIVALKLGLKVERFSIGFGPALWKKTWKGVEYRISAIPLGGYVSIPDVDPEGTKALEGAKDSAPKVQIPAWKELLVAVAGPAMNIVLAAILACVLALIPSARFGETTTEIGGFLRGSVAKEAGLKVGDVVTAIGGHPVATWSELMTEVQITDGAPTEFTVRRPKAVEETVTLCLVPEVDAEGRLVIGATCTTNETGTLIASFWPDGSVAEQAGLQVGDRILAVDGVKVRSDFDLFHELQLAPTNVPVKLTARRGDGELEVSVPLVEAKQRFGKDWATGWFMQAVCAKDSKVPEIVRIKSAGVAEKAGLQVGDVIVSVGGKPVFSGEEAGRALVAAAGTEIEVVVEREIPQASRVYEEAVVTIAPKRHAESGALFIGARSVASVRQPSAMMPARNPLKQLAWDAGSIFRILKALVTPKEAKGTGKAIGGPVLIAEGIYQSVRRDFTDGLGFLRFLNTNLAVMNLLPIPVLDGGLILFALIAIIFRRRVPEKVVAVLSTGFMYLLLALMAFLIYRDSVRSWKIHHIADPADRIETIAPEDLHAV